MNESDNFDELQSILAEQTHNIDALSGNIGLLAESLSRVSTKRDTWKGVLAVGCIILFFAFGTWYSASQNREVLRRLDDCLIEGGECHKEQQEQTAEILSILNCNQEALIKRAMPEFVISPYCEQLLSRQEP